MRLWPRKRVYVDDLPKTHDLRFFFVFLVMFVGIFGAIYVVGYLAAGDKLPAGTTVAGVDVGGMRRGQAITVLQEELAPRLDRRMKATVLGEAFEVNPQRAGLTFDIEATVDDALGGSKWDPRHMLKVLMGGSDVDPVVVVNRTELHGALARISHRVEQRPTNSWVSFEGGRPVPKYGEPGKGVDEDGTADRLTEALLAGERRVSLPVATIDPEVTATEAAAFANDTGELAVSGPIVLKVADARVELGPEQFAPALRSEVADTGLRLGIDDQQLYARTHGRIAHLPHHPTNARFEFRGDRVVVVPSVSGVTVDRADWASAVVRAAVRRGDARRAFVQPQPAEPRLTTKEARDLDVRQRVSSATTSYPAAWAADLRVMARQLDGTVLRPGQVFKFLDRVQAAPNPQAAGLLSSTAYDAAFFAGMGDLKATPNKVYWDRYPVGRDAQLDLVFTDNTPHGVAVRAWTTSAKAGDLHVEMWGTKQWRVTAHTSRRTDVVPPGVERRTGKPCTARPGVPGFRVEVTRVLARGDHVVHRDSRQTRYIPLDAVVCR